MMDGYLSLIHFTLGEELYRHSLEQSASIHSDCFLTNHLLVRVERHSCTDQDTMIT